MRDPISTQGAVLGIAACWLG